MQIRRFETRDGWIYADRDDVPAAVHGCPVCKGVISYLGIDQLELVDGVPGPWMARVQHVSGNLPDHLIPAENIANLTLR